MILLIGATQSLRVAAAVAAALLTLFALWMLWGGRDFSPEEPEDGDRPAPNFLQAFRRSLSRSSRSVLGMSALVVGYHLVAYANPHLPLVQVPFDRWWALALGVLIVIWASLAMDRLERR